MYQRRGTRRLRALREQVARQQAERFVRLQLAHPLPPQEPVSAVAFFQALIDEEGPRDGRG